MLKLRLEPLDYIHQHNMLGRDEYFDRIEFLNAFFEELLEYCQNNRIGLDKNGRMYYSRWNQVVNSFYQKFWAISKLRTSLRRDKKGLSKKLWGYFYCNYIIPERDRRFPHMAELIYQRKEEQLRELQDKINGNRYR